MRDILKVVFLLLSVLIFSVRAYAENNSPLPEFIKQAAAAAGPQGQVFLFSNSMPVDFPLEEKKQADFSWFNTSQQSFFSDDAQALIINKEGECFVYSEEQGAACTAFQAKAGQVLNSLAQCYLEEKKSHQAYYAGPVFVESAIITIMAVLMISAGGPFGWVVFASNVSLAVLLMDELFSAEDRAYSACEDKASVYAHLSQGLLHP